MLKNGTGQIKIAVDKMWPEDIPSENKECENSDYLEERGRRKKGRELRNLVPKQEVKGKCKTFNNSRNIYIGILVWDEKVTIQRAENRNTLRFRKLFLRTSCALLMGM